MTRQNNYLYVPAFLKVELDEDERQQLSTSAAQDIAKRTRNGGLFVFACLLLGSSISDFPQHNPFIHIFILSLSFLAGGIRCYISKKLPASPAAFIKWQWQYSFCILGSAITWFTFFEMHLSVHSFDQSTLILLIATAGYLGTLTSTMFMWLRLSLIYIAIVISPIFITLFLVDINTGLVLLIGFMIYLFFLLLQVFGLNKQYWQSLKAHILLERQAEELRGAKEEAEHAVQIKTQFLSSMSHELRTPMNAVIGFSHLLETDTENPLNRDQKESVSVIKASADHLLNLINDILDLVKVDAGQIKLDVKPMLIDDVIDEVVSIHQPKANTKQITLNKFIKKPRSYHVLADAVRLKQVLINLTSNAVKYNRERGIVNINAYREGANIIISIDDTGMGIDKEKFALVFEPFNRLGMEKTAISGTGIGLALSKDLVERMNGEIGFEANDEIGMTFWLKFKAL